MLSSNKFIEIIGPKILLEQPKKILISGPSGFVGSRLVDTLVAIHKYRSQNGVEPGELILLSASPGKLMNRLSKRYGVDGLKSIKASRADYYSQHDITTWTHHLGSLGAEGRHTVFVNLAAVSGPKEGKPHAMESVNYHAAFAVSKACEQLEIGHFIQSSSQAVNAERAGQVPYSKGKSMADFAMSRLNIPVSICVFGLLYCKTDRVVGQDGKNLNLIDLSLLPLTPILGNGTAPLQPLEVSDAAQRIAFLALSDPLSRPMQKVISSSSKLNSLQEKNPCLRIYEGAGPDVVSMEELLRKFAIYQGRLPTQFRPVYIGYRNMEMILNIKSFGNLNRQFVSLLRSEQAGYRRILGDHRVFEKLLGDEMPLTSLDTSFPTPSKRRLPLKKIISYVIQNPKVVIPGFWLTIEIILSYFFNIRFEENEKNKTNG